MLVPFSLDKPGCKNFRILALALVFLSTMLATLRLVHQWGANILFWDQWDFYSPYFKGETLWTAFRYQHSPHRQGLGAWVIALSDGLSAWDSRVLGYVIVGLLALSCLLALRLKVRLWGPLTFTDALIPALFFRVSQFESLVLTANPAHGAIPLFLILLSAFVLTWRPRWPQSVALGLLSFFAAHTGFGLFLCASLVGLLGLQALSDGLCRKKSEIRSHLFSLVLVLAGLGSFFVHYRHGEFASECLQQGLPKISQVLGFAVVMFDKYFGFSRTHVPMKVLGFLLFFTPAVSGLLYAVRNLSAKVSPSDPSKKYPILFVLLGCPILYALNASVGRYCLGASVAQSSRYMTHMIPLGLGFYFLLLNLKAAPLTRYYLKRAYFVLVIAGAFYLSGSDKSALQYYAGGKAKWAACYLAHEDIAQCDRETSFQIYPAPAATDLKGKLDFLKDHHLNLFKE